METPLSQESIDKLKSSIARSRGKRKVELMNTLAFELSHSNPKDALMLVREAQDLAYTLIHYQAKKKRLRFDRRRPEQMLLRDQSFGAYVALIARSEIIEGSYFLRTARYDQARAVLNQALERVQQLGDRHSECNIYNSLGYVYYGLDRKDEALRHFDRSLRLARSADLKAAEAQACVGLGRMLYLQGANEDAKIKLRRARTLSREIDNRRIEGMALLELGTIHWHTDGYKQEYLRMYAESAELFASIGDDSRHAVALHYLAVCNKDLGDYDKALAHLHASLDLYEKLKDPLHELTALLNIGEIHRLLNNYSEALSSYADGLARADAIDAPGKKAELLLNIGQVYSELGEHDKALEHFQQSLAHFRRLGMPSLEAQTQQSIGEVYRQQGRGEQALEYFERSRDIYLYLGQERAAALVQNNLAALFAGLGDARGALERFTESVAVLRRSHDTVALLDSMIGMAQVYSDEGRTAEAIGLLQESHQLAGETDAARQLAAIHRCLAQLYRRTGELQTAFEHFELYQAIDKKLFNKESDMRLKTLQVKYEVEQARRESELFRIQNESLRHEVELQRHELTSKAVVLAQKNEVLQKIKVALQNSRSQLDAAGQSLIGGLLSQIDAALAEEPVWAPFADPYQQVHRAFLQKLEERCPSLTTTELKVCILIRLELTGKEICRILNVAPGTVETYRYRIRKKLQLPPTLTLTTFLVDLDPAQS